MLRRTIVVLLLLSIALALLAAAGHFLLGWWRPAQPEVIVSGGGFEAHSEKTTLTDVLQIARDALAKIERDVHDFSGIMFKEEWDGEKIVKSYMFIKFRQQPFSVYLNFLTPGDKEVSGREVIFVQGQNDNNLLVHTPGMFYSILGTMHLDPNGPVAMRGEHHPITDTGLASLCRELIQRGEAAGHPRSGSAAKVGVRRYPSARINTRACTLFEIYPIWDEKTKHDYLARVFVDKEWGFPIRVEIYSVSKDRKQDPQLEEEYTYLDLKLNNGYTDADFNPKNSQYHFP
jgi:hypothetical protein